MEGSTNLFLTPTPAEKAKKRPKCPEKWKRNIEKRAGHRPKSLPNAPTCRHKDHSVFQCKTLNMQDIRRIHELYYKDATLESKKQYIIQHSRVASAKRQPHSEEDEPSNRRQRELMITHDLPKKRGDTVTNVKVCQNAFLSILGEKKGRVLRICKAYFQLGATPPEKRGGARKVELSVFKKEAVMNFIKKFRPLQSHYCRGKIKIRQYLDSELSIRKMWTMYLTEHGLLETTDAVMPSQPSVSQEPFILKSPYEVKYEFFRTVFNENFNIGFAAPYTDRCSACMRLEILISQEKNADKKEQLETELLGHKKRAQTFFDKIRNAQPDEVVFSYDCQKNLVLPKVPDQEAYYRRQLYLYNFTICEGISTENRSSVNTYSYVWTEDEFGKGSIQIASALYHRLCNFNFENKKTLNLFSDGCGGQNKNTCMIFMLQYWLLFKAPQNIEKIVIYFPIVGHSYLPPDRVFGNLEREFKTMSEIPNPETYLKIFKNHTTVIHLGDECDVLDRKDQSDQIIKTTTSWHFQFQKTKKIVLTRTVSKRGVLVQGEAFYNFEAGEPKLITKKNKSIRSVNLKRVPKGQVDIKLAKLSDVKRLLELHYGADWAKNPSLAYYTKVLKIPSTPSTSSDCAQLPQQDLQEEAENIVMELEIVGDEVRIVGGAIQDTTPDEPELDFDLLESDAEEMV